jgi:hypothetical protein
MDPTFFYATRQTAGRRDPGNSDLGNIVCRETSWQDSYYEHARENKEDYTTYTVDRIAVRRSKSRVCLLCCTAISGAQCPARQLGNGNASLRRYRAVDRSNSSHRNFTLGNIGLILTIWRKYKDLKVDG